MPVREPQEPPRLSRIELLGAWLGVWTPPREARVPPVPWRKVALGATLLGLAAVFAAVVVAPVINTAKDERSASEQRAEDLARTVRRARQRIEQRPRTGRLERSGGSRLEARVGVERAIGQDARERFSPRARQATCEVTAGANATGPRVSFDCLSSVREIVGAGEQEGARGQLGIPYRAVLDFKRRTYAYCKLNPIPGERVVPDPRDIVELPRPCSPRPGN